MLLAPTISQGIKALRMNGNKPFILNVQYAKTRFSKGVTVRGRTYNGKIIGPTFEIQPGDTMYVTMINKLPPNRQEMPREGEPVPQPATMMDAMYPMPHGPFAPARKINMMNNPHDFNTTNLHVHGIQTIPHLFKPLGTSDPNAPMIAIEPGQTFSYEFPIPKNHPSGLHWYHPHHHGSTDVQVSNGMAGLIVVRGPIDEVPEIKAAREIFVVVQTIDVNPTKTAGLYDREYIPYRSPQNGGYFLSTQNTMLTVNRGDDAVGTYWIFNGNDTTAPNYEKLETVTYNVQPGEVIRLRFLNGTNYYPLPLVLPGFEAYVIAFDGVNLLESRKVDMSGKGVNRVNHRNLLTAPTVLTSPGNRVEMLLKAPSTPGSYTLSSMAHKGLYFRPVPSMDLVKFVVSGSPVSMSVPTKLPKPNREYPVIDRSDIVKYREFTFAEKLHRTDLLFGVAFTINNKLYEESDCSTAPVVGTCEEWRIENAHDELHPFHLHENSFQLVKINDKKLDTMEVWDTFMVPPRDGGVNGSITVRIRFKQWYGKTVWHCHVLPHEDTGMMQNLLMV
jgi:suppressor of ftsI